MYVSSISLKNLRCFESARLKFQYPGREGSGAAAEMANINLLLGNNGSGKSTVLRALALSTVAPVIKESSGFVPYRLIRRAGPDDLRRRRATMTAELVLHPQDGRPRTQAPRAAKMSMDVVRKGDLELLVAGARASGPAPMWEAMFDNDSPAFLVLGYGATRRVEQTRQYDLAAQTKLRRLRYLRVAGLFESNVGLVPLASWLPQLKLGNPGRHTQVVHLVDRLLPEGASFEGEFDGEEYYFRHMGVAVPFGALSDGYRNYIGWIADMLYHLCTGCPSGAKLVDNRGLVLVDEVDLLLHPEWQRTVVETLSETLPNLQFVFTSHSPIVAGSLHRENIYVTEMDSAGSATVEQYKERIFGLNAEQVLHSSYFKLRTTRASGFIERELRPLSRMALRGDEEAAVALRGRLAGRAAPAPAKRGQTRGAAAVDLGRVDDAQFAQLLRVYAGEDDGAAPRGGGAARGAKGAAKAGRARAARKGRGPKSKR